RANDDGDLQLTMLLRQLCTRAAVPDEVTATIVNDAPLTPGHLRTFLSGLRKVDGRIAVECGDTIRALALYASDAADIGLAYLQGLEDAGDERRRWGMQPRSKPSRMLVRDISRVLALTGPSVIAVDQLDTLVNRGQDAIEDKVTSAELTQEIALIS